MIDFDDQHFRQTGQRTLELKSLFSKRNTQAQAMSDMYLMRWDDEDRVKRSMENVKLTKSPDARNAVEGAKRLLIATDPLFAVPKELNRLGVAQVSDKLEKAASALWSAAGRARKRPMHYDVVLSMLLYSEVFIAVTRTADMLAWAKGGSKGAQRRAERIASITPYVFDVWDAPTCYPEESDYGLTGLYRETSTTSGKVLDMFGKEAAAQFSDDGRNKVLTLCQWWDFEYSYAWVLGQGRPMHVEENTLGIIPVAHSLGEGSMLFDLPEEQRQPFLYTLWQSGLWDRQNLSLTVWYTMMFALGANPLYFERVQFPGTHLDVDHSVPGGRVTLGPGEEYGQIQHQPANPLLLDGMNIASQKVQESTIFNQTLGQPISGNAPYSMVALLHQAGRLPLLVPQKASGLAIAEATQIALDWWALEGSDGLERSGVLGELDPSEIPANYEMTCTLDVALPQDKLQSANIASMLTGSGTVSKQWVRENVLNIGQSSDMEKQIWREQASGAMFQQFMQDQIRQAQMAQQAQQQAMMQGGTGGPGAPGGQPGMMPQGGPDMGGMMPPEMQGAPGGPGGMGGLPPEMMGPGAPGMPGQQGGMMMPPGGGPMEGGMGL